MSQSAFAPVDFTDETQVNTLLNEIVRRLVTGLDPDCIFLFGSMARQEAWVHDIDLMVVVPDSDLPRHRREALAYDLLWGISTPVDVIVLTQAELEKRQGTPASLIDTIVREGKLLYERAEN